MKTYQCHVCRSEAVRPLLELGNQALCNRFLLAKEQEEPVFPLTIDQCVECGLVQIAEPVSSAELRPRFDWITYNEQEGHLDDLVERICKLPGLTTQSRVGAMSFKDDTTVERLKRKGFSHSWRLDPLADLGITELNAGLETTQAYMTPERAQAIVSQRGKLDLLIVRHILEHAHRPQQFATALRELVQPEGYLVFEVPDCAPALERHDYTMPWEEHIVYYTPETFQQSLPVLGFSSLHYHCYPYANENSLIGIVRPGKPSHITGAADTATARAYADDFQKYRGQVLETLKRFRENEGKIAIFGAGHLSCAWVNFMRLQDYIEFCVDDHPKKRGLFMPGSRLPIHASASLLKENIKLCLLSLSPESEVKVIGKNQDFLNNGGSFASIFPGKPNSLSLTKGS